MSRFRSMTRGGSFQLLSFKTKPFSLLSGIRSSNRPLSILVASLLLVFSSFVLIAAPAQASSCPTTYVLPVKGLTTVTLSEFLTANGVASSCTQAATAYFNKYLANTVSTGSASSAQTWSVRFNACMKGQSASIWNPGSYLNWTRCTFQVSFFPSSSVLGSDFNNVKATVNSHVPLAYISVVVSFFSTVSTNWGVTQCTANNLTFQMNVLSSSKPLVFAIPCNPPTAIHALRYLMVIGIWTMVIFFIYREVIHFLNEVMS